MRATLAIAGITIVMLCSTPIVNGEAKPVAGDSGVTVGEMRIQTFPPMTYLYMSAETTFEKMGEPVKEGYDKVFGAASEAKLLIARPTMMVYEGSPHLNPQKPFKLEFGILVADDTQAAGDCKVRKTDAFKCATILYTGPVDQQGQAYQKLIPALKAAGHTPTGEEREMCLYWEGLDSSNNVFMMQIGIK